MAVLAWWWWWRGGGELVVDAGLRGHLQNLFFACIGLSSNGPTVKGAAARAGSLWAIAIAVSIAQNAVGIALALMTGAPAALGIACGSASLMEGPAAGLAYAARFEAAGLAGAGAICVSASAFGIIAASLLGNPVATRLIRKAGEPAAPALGPTPYASAGLHLAVLVILAWSGLFSSRALAGAGLRPAIPPYIAALTLGLAARALHDKAGGLTLHVPTLRRLGAILSSLFLAHAMMDLRLEQLIALDRRSVFILAVEIGMTVILTERLIRWRMGVEYEGAVATAGSIGFALGITPNVVANMTVLGRRYGPAPEAMLAVPIVGTFLAGLSGPLVVDVFLALIKR